MKKDKNRLSKQDLARRISRRSLLNISESIRFIEILFDEMRLGLIKGKSINITNFGKFFLYKQKQRPVRNPKSKEDMILEPTNIVKFKPSVSIKTIIKDISLDNNLKEQSLLDNEDFFELDEEGSEE